MTTIKIRKTKENETVFPIPYIGKYILLSKKN